MNAPECWCQQHTLVELVMTSMTSQYDAMSDRRGYVWRRLFTGPCSNSWLNLASHGPQIPQCDRPKHFQTLLKWRLSLPLCSDFLRPPKCPGCSQQLDFFGDHILCCHKMGLSSRHNSVRDFFLQTFREAGFTAIPEVSIPGSTLTPADVLVDNFSQGYPAALDFSISHALRPSCNLAGVEVGKSASQAADEKIAQYEAPCATCHWKFIPVCMETTGFVCGEVNTIVGRLCRSLSERTGVDCAECARSLWSRLGLSLFSSIGTNLYRAYHPSMEDPPS